MKFNMKLLVSIIAVVLLAGTAYASITLFNFYSGGTVSVTVTTSTYTPPPPQFVISGALLFNAPPTSGGYNTTKATGSCTITPDGQSANCPTINLAYYQAVDPSGAAMSSMSTGQTVYLEVWYNVVGVECWNGHIPDGSPVAGRSICNPFGMYPNISVISSNPSVMQDTELCVPSGGCPPYWSFASPHPIWYAFIAQGNAGGGSATFDITVSYTT